MVYHGKNNGAQLIIAYKCHVNLRLKLFDDS